MSLLERAPSARYVRKELDRIYAVACQWLELEADESLIPAVLKEFPESPTTDPGSLLIRKLLVEKLGMPSSAFGLIGLGLLHAIRTRGKPGEPGDPREVAVTRDETADLDGLAARLRDPDLDHDDVRRATAFILFVLARHGPQALIAFGRALGTKASADSASRTAFGKSVALLELEWRESLEAEQRGVGFTSFVRWILKLVRPYPFLLLLLLVGNAVQVGYTVMMPVWLNSLFNNGILKSDVENVRLNLILLGGGFLFMSASGVLIDYCVSVLGPKAMNALRLHMFNKLQTMSARSFEILDKDEIQSDFSDNLQILEKAAVWAVPGIFAKLLILFGLAAVAFTLAWHMAILTAVTLAAAIWGPRALSKWAIKTAYARGLEDAKLGRVVKESIDLQSIVRAFSLNSLRLENFKRLLDSVYEQGFKQYFSSGLVGRATNFGISAAQLLVLGLGAVLSLQGSVSPGTIVAFITLLLGIGGAATFIGAQLPILIQAMGALQHIETLLAQSPDITEAETPVALDPPVKKVTVDHMSFSYLGDKINLEDINLSVDAPKRVALVGPSGSGKSTFLSLLMRQYDPTEGRIVFNDSDIRMVDTQSLSSLMSVVTQDTALFKTTVRENIRMGRLGASDDEVMAAAKAADVHDIIMSLPGGYDTDVGDAGKRLSGGQRQRIAIARALLRDPQILLLDEATSALDAASESEVNATIERVTDGRTVFEITHKLADCARKDLICVFNEGKLVEIGTHQELLAKGGIYAGLWSKATFVSVSDDGQTALCSLEGLQKLPTFADLPAELHEKLHQAFRTENVPTDTIEFAEGDPINRFCIIARGRVERTVKLANGATEVVEVLEEGDFFGESAILGHVRSGSTVRTVLPCTLLCITRPDVLHLFAGHKDLLKKFEADIRDRLDKLNDRESLMRLLSSSQDAESEEFLNF
jgi:ATP-binding cassette subfamily B protein